MKTEKNKNLLADRIKQLRFDRGISQKLLSQAIEISPQTLNDIEKKRANATIERAISMAQFFNVSLDYLVGLSDDPSVLQLSAFDNDPMMLLPSDEQELLLVYRSLSAADHKRLQELIKLLENVSKAYNFRYNISNESDNS